MNKLYSYENAIVYVINSDSYDAENLQKATSTFLKRVMKERNRNNGNSDTSRNIRKKQVLDK